MKLLAIDPGLARTGWCIYLDGELVNCGFTKSGKGSSYWDKTNHILDQLPLSTYDVFVAEVPSFNDKRARRGDPDKLVPMVMISVGARARCAATKTYFPRPSEWKGQTPKDVHQRRLVAQLDEYGVGLVREKGHDHHDVWDAVGLALWALEKEGKDVP